MRSGTLVIAVALVAVSCTAGSSGADLPPPTPPPGSTVTTDPPSAVETCGAPGVPFAGSGLVSASGSEEGDAATISSIRWERAEACDRVRIAFRSEAGAPATSTGPFAASVLPTLGVVRVSLDPRIGASGIADLLADTELVDRIYVVRTPARSLWVDLHLATTDAVEARAFVDGAEIVVDVRRGADRRVVLSPPRRSSGVVVLSPGGGPSLYPFRISGYAAPGSRAVRIRMTTETGILGMDRSVATPPGDDAWAAFDVAVDDGPSGMVELFVGTVDALGLDDEGITVPLDLP